MIRVKKNQFARNVFSLSLSYSPYHSYDIITEENRKQSENNADNLKSARNNNEKYDSKQGIL